VFFGYEAGADAKNFDLSY